MFGDVFNEIRKLAVKPLIYFSAFVIFIAIFIPVITYFTYAQDLQSKESIMNRNNRGLTLLDRFDRPFFEFYEARDIEVIPLKNIPLDMQQAVIAVEDKDFYKHQGFSLKAILRALITNISQRKIVSGGSTINQQLAKNSFLNLKRSFFRKYQEVFLAYLIDRKYSKEEILEMYLNSVFFGESVFGVQEAAETYFGKNASDLNLAEASFLAGILPAPSRLSPLANGTEAGKERQLIVLNLMAEQGYITEHEKIQAEQTEVMINPKKEAINVIAPHFALMVREELLKKFNEENIIRSGFKVRTTLNLDWQNFAENTVSNNVDLLVANNVTNGSAVVIYPDTGEIVVLVGSKDWQDNRFGKVNMALVPRQPGSSIKPIIYSAGIENKTITAATVLKDEPITYPNDYKPVNYDRKFRGRVSVRRALANSLNVPSVEVMDKVGISNGINFGNKMGIKTMKYDPNYGLALILGSVEVPLVELTGAYGVLANRGRLNSPFTILEIKNKSDEVIYTHNLKPKQVMSAEAAYIITSILTDTRTRSEVFSGLLNTTINAAVKTGTTENFKDALTLGYTPNLAVGVWVGNNDNAPMSSVAGSLGAAPIWRQLIERFSRDLPRVNFIQPPGLVQSTVCTTIINSSKKKKRNTSTISYTEFFIKGTESRNGCIGSLDAFTPSPEESISPSPDEEPEEENKNENQEDENLTPTIIELPTKTPTPTPSENEPVSSESAIILNISGI